MWNRSAADCWSYERCASELAKGNYFAGCPVWSKDISGAGFQPAPGFSRHMRLLLSLQIPAYHAYPASGDAEPKPLPKAFRLSLTVMLAMYFTFL